VLFGEVGRFRTIFARSYDGIVVGMLLTQLSRTAGVTFFLSSNVALPAFGKYFL